MIILNCNTVQEKLHNAGWHMFNDLYIDLDQKLDMRCPNGHKIKMTMRNWQEDPSCEICKEEELKKELSNIYSRVDGEKRVLSLDASTGTTGWALFDGMTLRKADSILITGRTAIARIVKLYIWLIKQLDLYKPDFVAIEDIQLQTFENYKGDKRQQVVVYKTLAHLQGVLMFVLESRKIDYALIHVAKWRSYWGIKAKARSDQKRSAMLKVENKFKKKFSEDASEAICLGMYVVDKHLKSEITMWRK
jgi:Holliday junction resolvasome RuvABC endonuclease subunit